jgi:hypothetical protein
MTTENETPGEGENKIAGEKKESSKSSRNLKILGYNLLVFALYTFACMAADSEQGGASALLISFFQFVVCSVLAIANKNAVWFLAGLLVLIIGLGTCVSTFHMGSFR